MKAYTKTMSTRNTNLPIPFSCQFNVATSGTPEQLSVKLSAATISFTHVTGGGDGIGARDTISDSASNFLAAGFEVGDQITVSGAANAGNNASFIIHAVTAGVITVSSKNTLTTEAAGATVKIVTDKTAPDGISVTIKAKYANTGLITVGYSSDSALNTKTGYFGLRNNEAISLQVNSLNKIWLDAAVSGEGVEVSFEKNIAQTI